MTKKEIRVPDIGDFKDVPVIEVLVTPGDKVKPEDPLITLESDKATMEVPSPQAGKIVKVEVKVGDKVSEGTLIADARRPKARQRHPQADAITSGTQQQPPAAAAPAPTAATHSGCADITCEVLVLGAGPGGYSAAFRVRRPRHEDGARRALGKCSAASASTSAASRPRRCCTPPPSWTKPRPWPRTASPSAHPKSIWPSCAPTRIRSSAS